MAYTVTSHSHTEQKEYEIADVSTLQLGTTPLPKHVPRWAREGRSCREGVDVLRGGSLLSLCPNTCFLDDPQASGPRRSVSNLAPGTRGCRRLTQAPVVAEGVQTLLALIPRPSPLFLGSRHPGLQVSGTDVFRDCGPRQLSDPIPWVSGRAVGRAHVIPFLPMKFEGTSAGSFGKGFVVNRRRCLRSEHPSCRRTGCRTQEHLPLLQPPGGT